MTASNSSSAETCVRHEARFSKEHRRRRPLFCPIADWNAVVSASSRPEDRQPRLRIALLHSRLVNDPAKSMVGAGTQSRLVNVQHGQRDLAIFAFSEWGNIPRTNHHNPRSRKTLSGIPLRLRDPGLPFAHFQTRPLQSRDTEISRANARTNGRKGEMRRAPPARRPSLKPAIMRSRRQGERWELHGKIEDI